MRGGSRGVRQWGRPKRSRLDGTDHAAALARVPVFEGCTKRELARIDALTFEVALPKGYVLARQDAPVLEVYFVVSGAAIVTRDGAMVGALEPGACVGAAEMFANRPYAVSVTATTPLLVRVASPREMRSLVDGIPRLAHLRLRHVLPPAEAGAVEERRPAEAANSPHL